MRPEVVPSMKPGSGEPLVSTMVAALLIAGIEIAAVGGGRRPLLAIAVIGVCAAAGGVIGGAIAVGRALSRRCPRPVSALVLAAPALVVLVPLGRSLFQGAFAATLPGARWAPLAIPALGWLAISIATAAGSALMRGGHRGSRGAVAAVLLVGAFAIGVGNRMLFRSGYPEIHLALAVATLALGGLGLELAIADRWPRRARGAAFVGGGVAIVVAALWGLEAPADRAAIAQRGDDSRHLVRVARAWIDLDRDGVSPILGGGDCADLDPRRHGGARDVPGNQLDEDCDGVDAPRPRSSPVQPDRLAAWRAEPATARRLAALRDANLVIISVDALRADQLVGDHRYEHLGALLTGAHQFRHGFAPAAGTDVSLTTFVTGRWNPFQPLDTTLFEALAGSGRLTHAILPREVLRYVPETLLTRGLGSFDRVVTDGGRRDVGDRLTSRLTTDHALAFLDRSRGRGFALWAHYFDVHEHGQLEVPAEELARTNAGRWPRGHKYRALLGVVDREIGRLLAGLSARGLAERTVVVFFADHGESLGEDPRLPEHHGLVVYQALTHVPVAIRVPGTGGGEVDDQPVSLVDLAPTILGLVGVAPLPGGDGIDLTANVLGAPPEATRRERALVMNEQDQWAVVDWPWKLLVRTGDNLVELYDLSTDPGERVELSARRPELVTALRARYGEFPPVPMDRSQAGRRWREAQAQPPRRPSPR